MVKALAYPLSALLWSLCIGWFAVTGPLYVLLSLVLSPKTLHPYARLVCLGVLVTAGQRFEIRGPFPALERGPYLYVFNHGSMLDTFALIGAIPEFVAAVGKAEQFDVPLWGTVLRRWGVVPVQRDDLEEAIESLNAAGLVYSTGQSLLISPEGTRSEDGRLGPFKKGPFHLARQLDAPIVPLLITGAHRAKRRGSWLLRPGRITLEVGTLVTNPATAFDSVEALRDEVRARFVQ